MRAAALRFANWPRRLGIALVFCAFLTNSPDLTPQDEELSVRAAYLLNLTKYVEWPPSQKRIVLGVMGNNATAAAIGQLLNDKITDGRPIRVIQQGPNFDLRCCDVMYFDQPSKIAAQVIRERQKGMRCITVGDSDRFVLEGGMVGLVRSGDQIQILVNLEATQREGVVLSSRLLNLAVLVRSSRKVQ